MGFGAQFASSGDPRTTDLIANQGTNINARNWSHPVYLASASDPVNTVTDRWGTKSFRIPANASPALPVDGDAHMAVVDPSRSWVDEMYGAHRTSATSWSVDSYVRNDLRGPGVGSNGTRAYGGSSIAGLMRVAELQQGWIPHALALALPRSSMKIGPVWPAIFEDSGAPGTYLGNLPMGSFVGIPPSVDVESLGLSPTGLVIARALQRYGAYLVDASSGFVLFAEPDADSMLSGARADLPRIRALVRVVTNNAPTNVGGGGSRLANPAPPFN